MKANADITLASVVVGKLHSLSRGGGRIRSIGALMSLALSAWFATTVSFAQTSPSAYATGYRYSLGGKLTGVIQAYSGTGSVSYLATRNTYNSAGLLVTVEKGALGAWQSENVNPSDWPSHTTFTVFEAVTYGYDSMGRVLWKQESSNGAAYALTQYSYDVMGRQQCAAIRMNSALFTGSMPGACTLSTPQGSYGADRITYTQYDLQGHPSTITRAYGTSLQEVYATYTYTPNGLALTTKDANGNLTTNSYDGLDRLSTLYFPSKTTPNTSSTTDFEQYTYDNNSNRRTLVTRDSQTITYNYDALNRLTSKLWPSSSGVSVYYGYDLRNLQLYANYGSTTGNGVSHSYDGFGQVQTETTNSSGTARSMTYQYDADGDRTQVKYPDQNYAQYTYDGLDRLARVLENGNAVLVEYTYDGAGRVQQLSRGGGVTTTTLGYDGVYRVNALSLAFTAPIDNISFSFGYSPADQMTNQSVSNAEYDPLAKSATQRYTPNGLNQYSAVGGTTFLWDPRGNLTSDGSNTYTYDVENHLTAASGAHNASLSYDPLGRLYQTTSGSAATTFGYDEDRITSEYDGSGNLLRRYVYGLSGDDPVVWYEGSGVAQSNRRYLHADHQGSIIAITDGSGVTLAVNQYDPYGVRNSLNQGRLQYTGQAYVPELGLYYYKARMYNPAFGRFMQTDPIGYKDNLNLYAYAGNDPVDNTDPSGTTCSKEGSGVGIMYVCQVDSIITDRGVEIPRDQFTKAQVARVAEFEKAYTAAENQLATDPSKTVSVSLNGNSADVTQGAVADALANRKFEINDSSKGPHVNGLGTTGNTTYIGEGGLNPVPKSLVGLSLKSVEFAIEIEVVHEALHGSALNIDSTLNGGKTVRQERSPHQGPYNLGAYRLLYPDNRNDFP